MHRLIKKSLGEIPPTFQQVISEFLHSWVKTGSRSGSPPAVISGSSTAVGYWRHLLPALSCSPAPKKRRRKQTKNSRENEAYHSARSACGLLNPSHRPACLRGTRHSSLAAGSMFISDSNAVAAAKKAWDGDIAMGLPSPGRRRMFV